MSRRIVRTPTHGNAVHVGRTAYPPGLRGPFLPGDELTVEVFDPNLGAPSGNPMALLDRERVAELHAILGAWLTAPSAPDWPANVEPPDAGDGRHGWPLRIG
jgi:hypothetical protein